MLTFLKKNISKSAFFGGIAIAALLLLVNSLIKGIFILSNESAVQKATPVDIVLGTLSLGLVIVAILGLGLASLIIYKKKEFNNHVIFAILGAASLLVISGLLVVVKDHTSYTTDWAKLNDIAKARADIGKNLVVANSLVGDGFGNAGAINPAGTSVADLAGVITNPQLLNHISVQDYQYFLNQVIQSKKDLAALYAVDELLNTAHQPLIAGRIVDALAAAWEHDHTITVSSWMASKANTNAYDFLSVTQGYTHFVPRHPLLGPDNFTEMYDEYKNQIFVPDAYVTTPGLAGDATVNKLLSSLQTPLVFSGLTTTYLIGFPITITGIALVAIVTTSFIASSLVMRKVSK